MYAIHLVVLYLSIETVYSSYIETVEQLNKKFDDWYKNRYQVYGITNKTQELCTDNCVDGKCGTGGMYTKKRKACTVDSSRITHVYFTSNHLTAEHVCLTRCAKFDREYEWCYVDNRGNFDFCSSEIYKGKFQVQHTLDGQRCLSPCYHVRGWYNCRTIHTISRECVPNQGHEYMVEKTITGDTCYSKCRRDRVEGWTYMCHNMKMEYVICAPPAQILGRHTKEIYDQLYRVDRFEYQIPYYDGEEAQPTTTTTLKPYWPFWPWTIDNYPYFHPGDRERFIGK